MAVVAGCALSLPACQDNAWDDHYAVGGESGKSLMQLIEERPELSRFATMVKENNMEELLSSSQTFTVFAPDNNAMAAFNLTSDTLEQFLYNHICRYTYTTGDIADADEEMLRVKMLNGKYQNLGYTDGRMVFGNDAAVAQTVGASNGVLNTVGTIVPFYRNLYEEIKSGQGTDSVSKYLRAMDEYTFLPQQSTVVGVNEKGETVYDSVFNFRNNWMRAYGDIYKEDSVYTMLVPTDVAWDRQYAKISPYFRTVGLGEMKVSGIKVTGNFETGTMMADSLCSTHTRQSIMHDMVFRRVIDVEHPDGDSIQSTAGHVFHAPQPLFVGAEKRDVSNGVMYVTDDVKYDPTVSWHEEIRVEAEYSVNYATQYVGSVSSRNVENYPQFAGLVSENHFLNVTPPALSFQKNTVRFRLPNTLAAKYNIYLVTVPGSAIDTTLINKPEQLKSTKLNFYLTYVHEDGTLKEEKVISTPVDFDGTQTPTPIDASKPEFVTNATAVDKMLVATNFKFPYANYTGSPFAPTTTEETTTAYLRVECAVTKAADLKVYEKNMRIDCVILEPVN